MNLWSLEFLKPAVAAFAILQHLVCIGASPVSLRLLDVGLELKSQGSLFSLDQKIRLDLSQEIGSCLADNGPADGTTVNGMRLSLADRSVPKVLHESAHGSGVGHVNDTRQAEAVATVFLLHFPDGNASFPVEETSRIGDEKATHLGLAGMMANSVDTRCPATSGAEGQYRTKQGGTLLPGVRNEHVPSPKGKMCSELLGNQERATETFAPYALMLAYRVTDCNNCTDGMIDRPTDIISSQDVFEYYNRTNTQLVRYIREGGDQSSADLSIRPQGLEYQGIRWVWSRQCPAGTLYMLNRKYVHFMVDPRFKFEWTDPLTYPNQMMFTRLVGLRLFLCYKARMYHAVMNGWTA